MISLEQVKLLEAKVSKTIDYVKKVTEENTQLKERLLSNQKRIDELEVLVTRFKQDQNRIEDGILSALDRLNQFEGALETALSKENSLSAEGKVSSGSKVSPESAIAKSKPSVESKPSAEIKPPKEPVLIIEEEPLIPEEEQSVDSGELDIF